MYPSYVVENLGDLSNYLLGAPASSELDERGCFSKSACADVERLILTDLGKKLSGLYFNEEQARGTNPDNRWRTVSCMQKAVRFGDRPMARFCASVGYDMDAKHVLRRLAVIALEDVGAADLYGVLAVLAVMGSASWRKACDERRLMVFLADRLASQHGDRNLTDLLNSASFDVETPKNELASKPTRQLLEMTTSGEFGLVARQLAIWTAAGTKAYGGLNMPKDNDRVATPTFRMMAEQGLSRAFLYGAAKTASRLHDPFWVCFYLTHVQLSLTSEMVVIADPPPPTPLAGKLLAAAYDMHTREGKEAIRRFAYACADLKPFRKATHDWNGFLFAVSEAVFYVEGGRLASRVAYCGSEGLRELSWRSIMSSCGLAPELHAPLFAVVEQNLPQLHQLRESVLWSKLAK